MLNAQAIKFIYLGLLLSAIMPFIVKDLSIGFHTRQGLSFPNPNQLAYFAQIIIASVILLNHHAFKFHPVLKNSMLIRIATISIIILGHCYTLLSASRAGLAGVAILDLIAIWKWRKLFVASFLGLAIAAIVTTTMNMNNLDEMKMYKRMMAGSYYSGLSERTEDRFNFEDLSLVFGGGKTRRSLDEKKTREFKEVHNTLGDVVYSYGLIGGALFMAFIGFYFRACSAVKFNVIVLLSFLPLHVTHNMIRFRFMWILYALVYSACLVHIHSINSRVHSQERVQRGNAAAINYAYAASAPKKS